MKTALQAFEKELDAIREAGTWREERIITTPQRSCIDTTQKKHVVNMCANNYLAIGCLQMLRQKGVRIPEDMALMTFDNYPFSMLLKPQLTAIEVDMFELGWEAAHFMLQKLRKPHLQTQSFCTVPTLLEREST